jgi:hypothetical protein
MPFDYDDLDLGGGEFTPFLKFNAKAKEWTWSGDGGPEEIASPKFVIDLEHIRLGWLRLEEGTRPDWALDPAPGERAPRPSERHKRAFLVRVQGRDGFEGVGEFSSCATGVGAAIRELYRTYKSKVAEHPDRLPVVEVTGYEAIKGRFGTNYSPKFKITGWAKRSPEMLDEPLRPNGAGRSREGEDDDEPLSVRERLEAASRRASRRQADLEDELEAE